MATNFYFDNVENSLEQQLFEELSIEAIQIHGVNVYYLPRKIGNFDPLYQEDGASYYDAAYLVDMYVKNPSSGFGGKGDFLSGLGMEIRDNLTLVVARRTWISDVGEYEQQVRPNEGDLIYFPLNKKIFKISFVEHESIFYQAGALQVWELRTDLFEYSGEVFDTGIPEVDRLTDKFDINIVGHGIALESGTGSVLDELNGLPILFEDYENTGEDDINALNDYYQEEGSEFLDFSCTDPFVAPDGTY